MKMYRLSIACVSMLLSACSASYMSLNVKPTHAPMYNMTQSSAVLACVGKHIEKTGGRPVDVFIADVPDHTTPSIESGFLTKNAVMMVTTAVDRLGTNKVEIVGKHGGDPTRRQVQILGAWTELNRTSSSDALKGKASLPGGFILDMGGDRSFNHIALDMSLAENNRIIPLTATSVSIQVDTRSGNSTLTYDEGGDFAAVGAIGFTAQEGFHSAERLLVETSIALMMSRYFGVNLKDCLQRTDHGDDKTKIDQDIFSSSGNVPPAEQPTKGKKTDAVFDVTSSIEKEKALPSEDGVVVLSRAGKSKKYLLEQPQEYAASAPVMALDTKNDAQAIYNLGIAYAEGRGIEKNSEEAIKLMLQAAHQNHTDAQAYLGALYSQKGDYQNAVAWSKASAERGSFEGQYNLAMLYASGAGVAQSDKDAYFWLSLAERQRKTDAVKVDRQKVSERLSAQDRAEVLKRVEVWHTKQ